MDIPANQLQSTLTKNLPLQIADLSLFDSSIHYLNSYKLFFSYFKKLPNLISVDNIDNEDFKKWLEDNYADKIIHQHYSRYFASSKKKLAYSYHHIIFKNEIIVSIEESSVFIHYSEEQKETVEELYNECITHIHQLKLTNHISIIYSDFGDLKTKRLEIKKPKINFNIHYNEDFYPIHKKIIKQLNKNETTGLYLFHGQPGTGKSTYIKYLIHQLKKKVIFISPKMAGELDNLSMTPFLLNNKNSVFILEDSEELITSREEIRNSSLAMLLNLTDGLLGESLGIQIIATFNTDVKNIDKALMRKGRLSQIYEFKPLSIDRTNKLLNVLKIKETVNQPLPVADIFNFEKDNHYRPNLKRVVGFGG